MLTPDEQDPEHHNIHADHRFVDHENDHQYYPL